MAFLLSPKTGGGAVYTFESDGIVSLNGAEPRKYALSDGVTVKTGDVISASANLYILYSTNTEPDHENVKEIEDTTSPYTVETVQGSTYLYCEVKD